MARGGQYHHPSAIQTGRYRSFLLWTELSGPVSGEGIGGITSSKPGQTQKRLSQSRIAQRRSKTTRRMQGRP